MTRADFIDAVVPTWMPSHGEQFACVLARFLIIGALHGRWAEA